MKIIFSISLLLNGLLLYGQSKPEDFGYRYEFIEFEGDTVHILISSKPGEENKRKPILIEVQGSTATPLIVHNGKRITSSVSLLQGYAEEDFHLILINKPGLPLIAHQDILTKGKYKDPKTGQYPDLYIKHNNLDYYVERNHRVLDYLKQKAWVDTSKIVVQGHSEGSTIAVHMAGKTQGITHLIYSGGLPYFPRILSMVQQERQLETDSENPWVEKSYDYWQGVVDDPLTLKAKEGWNTNSGTYSFSQSENEELKRLKIPVLISYGTRDEAAPFNDMFRIEAMMDKCAHIDFKAYVGLDHYYQSKAGGDQLTDIVKGWLDWISAH